MAAQLIRDNEHNSNKLLTDQHLLALNTHRDFEPVSMNDLNYERISYLALFPKFIINFQNFVRKLIVKHDVHFSVKLRYIGYLSCIVAFSQNNQKFIDEMRSCFDLALYVRATSVTQGTQSAVESVAIGCSLDFEDFDPSELNLFKENNETLIKAIYLLLKR